jgi:hypothetical protein
MNKEKSKARVIYIMGVEHNGSTFLGVTLGNHPNIEFAGELSLLPREGWLSDYACACGDPITGCRYWNEIREVWESLVNDRVDSLVKLEQQFDRNRRLPNVFFQKYLSSHDFYVYGQYTKALFTAVSQVSGRDIVVDSSKRFSRALALSLVDGIDLHLLHLLRDARGVAYSWSKPTRPRQRSWWNASIRWNIMNAASGFVSRNVKKDKVMRLRYEDFISDPVHVLREIGHFVDVSMDQVTELLVNNAGLTVGHVGVGNGFLQRNKKVYLRSNIEWLEKMPQSDQQNVWRITKYGMHRYGYEKQIDCSRLSPAEHTRNEKS